MFPSKIQTISNLLKLQGITNRQPVIYKKTAQKFKKEYGIELKDAPEIFVKNGVIWQLAHINHKYRGRIRESAKYNPIIGGLRGKFQRLERNDIKTSWDKK